MATQNKLSEAEQIQKKAMTKNLARVQRPKWK